MSRLFGTLRPGWLQSSVAALFAVATYITVVATATEQESTVRAVCAFGVAMFLAALVIGLPRIAGGTTVLILGSALLEAGLNDDPTWIRSLGIGCLWYVTVEIAWDAIERRDGSVRTREVETLRIQEVVTVVLVTLLLGFVAIVATEVAPVRSLVLQALAVLIVLGTLITAVRNLPTRSP